MTIRERGHPDVLTRVGWLLFVSVLWLSSRCFGQTYDGFSYAVNMTNITITGYTGPGGAVTIPASIPGVNGAVTSIGQGAFALCSNLTSVIIPNGVISIGDVAFLTCTHLTNVTIPSSVTSIGNQAFDFCTGLTSVNFPIGVVSLGAFVFADCYGLTNLTIPGGVTSIGEAMFDSCTGLTSVTIPNSVTNLGGGAFHDCTGLTNVTIGNGVAAIDAFEGCTSLTSVTIPNNVTSIGGAAFAGCTRLTSVTIPSSVTSIDDGGYAEGDAWGAFLGCSGLTNVILGNGLTSIGFAAFYMCSALTSVTIPSGVTNIGEGAFGVCSGLTNAFFQGNAPSGFGWGVFDSAGLGFSIYYPSTASGWSTPTWQRYPAQPYNYAAPVVAPVFTSLMRGWGIVTPWFNGLSLGTNYQLQVSTDLGTWSNSGPVFTATNASQAYAQPFYVTNANHLFFRLQASP